MGINSKTNKIKISLTTTSEKLGVPNPDPSIESKESSSARKKGIIKDIFGSDDEENPESESKTKARSDSEKKYAENYSDVSDKEIDSSQASKDLSVSPINSDLSESFTKAATLEGLNPETISPE